MVDIATEWNLKLAQVVSVCCLHISRYSNRMEFKVLTNNNVNPIRNSRYSNRMEFKDDYVSQGGEGQK